MPEVLIQVLWRRRFWLIWWSLGILAADALLAIAYPTVRDNKGKVVLSDVKGLYDPVLEKMPYVVEGVVGSIN